MTQPKIDGKFYPLTSEIGQKLRAANLTAAEWRLWSYFVEIDSFGDRYEQLSDTLTIMQVCNVKKSTFYKAIAKFQSLELFDFQDKGFFVRNLGFPKNRKAVRENGKLSEKSETIPKNRKAVRENGNDSEKSENRSPKPASQADSNSPQTNKTNKNNKISLSEEEREKFSDFCLRKARELPQPPVLVEKWISKHEAELFESFKKEAAEKSSPTPSKITYTPEEIDKMWNHQSNQRNSFFRPKTGSDDREKTPAC